MRTWFACLLLLNVAFLGWARLVDRPQPPPLEAEKATVPTLHLASEPGALAAVAPHCISLGPFKEPQPQEIWRVALTTTGFAPRARTEGDPSTGWLDVDLPAGQAALDVTRLPGKLTLAGLTQGQCATVAGPGEAPSQEPVATPPADAPVDAPSEAASAGKPLAG